MPKHVSCTVTPVGMAAIPPSGMPAKSSNIPRVGLFIVLVFMRVAPGFPVTRERCAVFWR